jgi:hypothetical protein
MIQKEIRHPAGTFPGCTSCGREPKHIEGRGSHSGEAFDVRHPTGTRHALECRCGARTQWCSSLALALNHWRQHFSQPEMPAPQLAHARNVLHLHKANS